jgi:nucleoside-diphosphate-sugar epimerase
MFVLQAFQNGKITILGGDQIRPNIHIQDMADVYIHFIKNYLLPSGAYNAGFENLKLTEIAEKVLKVSKAESEILPSNDPRSYRIDSTKLMNTNFAPRYGVEYAIQEIYDALQAGSISDDPRFHTVKWMIANKIGV